MSRFCWPVCACAIRASSRCCSIGWNSTPPMARSAWDCTAIRRRGRRSKKCWPRFRKRKSSCGANSRTPSKQLDAPEPQYEPEPFDILAEYPERELPSFDVLTGARTSRFARVRRTHDVRAGAAHSFFNADLNPKARAALFEVGADPIRTPSVRGASLGVAGRRDHRTSPIREAMLAILNDDPRPTGGRARRRGRGALRRRRSGRCSARASKRSTKMGGPRAREGARSHVALAVEAVRQVFPAASGRHRSGDSCAKRLRGAGYFRAHRLRRQNRQLSSTATSPIDRSSRRRAVRLRAGHAGRDHARPRRGMLRKDRHLAQLTVSETNWSSLLSTNAFA